MPAPLHLLGSRPYTCGCGRDWGCVEVYTSLSGLPHLLAEKLASYPDHPLAHSPLPIKERVFSLRGLAQKGDPLAVELFDFQARAMGLHVATLAMALDPQFVVIGGGLMDPEATSEAVPRALPADRARVGPALSVARAAQPPHRRRRRHWAICPRRLERRWWRLYQGRAGRRSRARGLSPRGLPNRV